MNRLIVGLCVCTVVGLVACGNDDAGPEQPRDASVDANFDSSASMDLRELLENAPAGSTITLSAATYTGDMVVLPAGVNLQGSGQGETVLAVSGITISATDEETSISNLTIRSTRASDVLTIQGTSDSSFALSGTRIEVLEGAGLVLENVGSVTVSDTTLAVVAGADAELVTGIVLRDVAADLAPATFERVTIDQFGPIGYLVENSWADLSECAVGHGSGSAVAGSGGGRLTFDTVTLNADRGASSADTPIVSIEDDTEMVATNLTISGSGARRAIQHLGSGHARYFDSAIETGGLRFEGVGRIEISNEGASTLSLDGADEAAIAVRDCGQLLLDNIEITSVVEANGIADGIHVAASGQVMMSNVTVSGAPRVGILLAIGDPRVLEDSRFTNVSVSASGDDGLGAIAQNASAVIPVDNWGPVLRDSLADKRDRAATTVLTTIDSRIP